MIRASAGTGKTFQLSNRYLQLILTGHVAERILATTFTRKAAGEILSRILIRLAKAAVSQSTAKELADQLALPQLTLADCRATLRQLTTQLHRLRISTLDSFFLQATQALSLDLGLPPNWRILDETDELPLREAAIGAMLQQNERATVTELLRSIALGNTHRGIRRLLSDTVSDMYQVYLESPPEAWRRLSRRRELAPEQLDQLLADLSSWVAGYPGVRLRNAVESLARRFANEEWDELPKAKLVKSVIEGDLTYCRKDLPDNLVPLLETLVGQASAVIQNRYVNVVEATHDLLDRFHRQFELLKLDRRVLRFDDLARQLGRLEQSGQLARLSFRLDTTLDALLLDEFQDTSLAQWRVLRPFARHASGTVPGHSFLCVGDTKQAIYGWRGGDAELMDAVSAELSSLEEETLRESYRSSQPVITVVNRVNQHMDRHGNLDRFAPAVERWVKRFPEHETMCKTLPGYVSLETTEWAKTADELRELAIQLAAERVADVRQGRPHVSVAVLVRTNELVGRMMHALQKQGIPASEEGGNPLTDSAAVQLVLSLLTLADHPQDLAARYHLAHSPWATSLGLTSFQDLSAARALSRQVHQSLANVGYGEVIQDWIGQLKPYCNAREWRRLNQLAELAYRYQQQIETPCDVGYHQQHVMPLCTAEFVRRVGQQRISDPTEDPVRVMTIHQAKGLEFDVVILPHLDGIIGAHSDAVIAHRPHPTKPIEIVMPWIKKDFLKFLPPKFEELHHQNCAQQLQEELCVLYVALTRAVHSLQMIVAPGSPKDNDQTLGEEDHESSAGEPSSAKGEKLPVSMAGLIRAALTDGQPLAPSQLVFAEGDPNWRSRLQKDRMPTACASASLPLHVELRSATPASGVAERQVRPSQLEGGGVVRLKDRLSLPGQAAMQRGSLIHAFFEQMEWLDDRLPAVAELEAIGRSLDTDLPQLAAAIADFQQMLTQDALRRLLSRAAYQHWIDLYGDGNPHSLRLEARREQPVTAREGDDWLSGNIDRLVLLYRRDWPVSADIVDFKTDVLRSPASLAERVEYYRPQLMAYRRGISRMLRLDIERISAHVVFVGTADVIDLTPSA
jgi:ATP-dependent exoDNAse (exonuclease V) beta subunit